MNIRNTDEDLEAIAGRLEFDQALSAWIDPVTGYTMPAISGSQEGVGGDAGGDGSGGGDGAEGAAGDGGDGGEGADGGMDPALLAAFAKAENSGKTAGKRQTLKELGFKNMREAKAALEALNQSGNSNGEAGGNTSGNGMPPAPAPSASALEAVLRGDVTSAVAASGIDPAMISSGAIIAMAGLDVNDEPGSAEIASAVDALREQHPAWWPNESSGGDSQQSGPRGIPGPGRTPPAGGPAKSQVDSQLERAKRRLKISD